MLEEQEQSIQAHTQKIHDLFNKLHRALIWEGNLDFRNIGESTSPFLSLASQVDALHHDFQSALEDLEV